MKKDKLNIIINIICSMFVIFYLNYLKIIPSYSLLSVILLYIVYKFFSFSPDNNKKEKISILILSIILSIIYYIGKISLNISHESMRNLKDELLLFENILTLIFYFILFKYSLSFLFKQLLNYSDNSKYSVTKKKKIFVFIYSFLFIMIGWSIYFFALYPGVLTYDSITTITAVINNKITSDHHPVFYQLFLLLTYKIGGLFFKNINSIIAFMSIIQMIIMSLIISYFILFMYERKTNKIIIVLVLLFYTICPIFGYYSVTMWKDVLFGGFFLLFILSVIKLIERKDSKYSKKELICYSLITLLMLFYRNNAVYMFVLFFPFTVYFLKNNRKNMTVISISIIVVYFIIKGPIFSAFNINKSSSLEYLGIPIHQISRMCYKNIDFTENERALINDLMPIERLRELYYAEHIDNIKSNGLKVEPFDNNKMGYLKMYLSILHNHTWDSVESYLISTLGYWHPNVQYWSVNNDIMNNDFGIHSDTKSNFLRKCVVRIEDRNFPIISMQWSIGLCLYIMIVCCIISVFKKGLNSLLIYIPLFGIWFTLLIASPIWGEFRYVFCGFMCLPLIIYYPYLKEKRGTNGR